MDKHFAILTYGADGHAGIGIPWDTDLAAPGLLTVVAGKTVKMGVWNIDTQQRANGGIVIAKEA